MPHELTVMLSVPLQCAVVWRQEPRLHDDQQDVGAASGRAAALSAHHHGHTAALWYLDPFAGGREGTSLNVLFVAAGYHLYCLPVLSLVELIASDIIAFRPLVTLTHLRIARLFDQVCSGLLFVHS